MTEFNSSDAGPLGAGDGCVLPRDGQQVCTGTAADGIFLPPKKQVCITVDGMFVVTQETGLYYNRWHFFFVTHVS